MIILKENFFSRRSYTRRYEGLQGTRFRIISTFPRQYLIQSLDQQLELIVDRDEVATPPLSDEEIEHILTTWGLQDCKPVRDALQSAYYLHREM